MAEEPIKKKQLNKRGFLRSLHHRCFDAYSKYYPKPEDKITKNELIEQILAKSKLRLSF